MTIDRCPWYVAGPLMGLLIIGLRAVVNKPFGALGGYIDLAESKRQPGRLGFRAFLLLGLIAGGSFFAATLGSFSLSLGYATGASLAGQLALLVIAGTVMGFGARTAGGCTSGHGLCGMSLGSPASVVAVMTFFGAAVAMEHGLSWMGVIR